MEYFYPLIFATSFSLLSCHVTPLISELPYFRKAPQSTYAWAVSAVSDLLFTTKQTQIQWTPAKCFSTGLIAVYVVTFTVGYAVYNAAQNQSAWRKTYDFFDRLSFYTAMPNRFWSYFTASFFHRNSVSLAISCTGIWFVGPHMYITMGAPAFAAFYLNVGLWSLVASYYYEKVRGNSRVLSGAINCVVGLFALATYLEPTQMITFNYATTAISDWLLVAFSCALGGVVAPLVFPSAFERQQWHRRHFDFAGNLGAIIFGVGWGCVFFPEKNRKFCESLVTYFVKI